MHITNANQTTSSKWHEARDIRQAVKSLDSSTKAALLTRIDDELLAARLFGHRTPDSETLAYVTALLQGKRRVR